MNISLRQLEIFTAVVQESSVTAAARRVGLSQAATSQALAELENQLQRRLFDRHGRRITLNAAGRAMFPAAIEVLDRVRDMAASAARPQWNLRLFASLTAGNYMLPPLLARFARRYRHARFQVGVGNTGQVIRSLLRFESDAGWIEGSMSHPELKAYPWLRDELVIVGAPDHPLAGRRARESELADARWVLREKGSGTRQVFENAIEGRFRLEEVALELGGIGAVKRAVIHGAGLTCISRSAVKAELARGELRRVLTPWLELHREITVLVHRQKFVDQGLRAFLTVCGIGLPAA